MIILNFISFKAIEGTKYVKIIFINSIPVSKTILHTSAMMFKEIKR
jgi:hypothetical protein